MLVRADAQEAALGDEHSARSWICSRELPEAGLPLDVLPALLLSWLLGQVLSQRHQQVVTVGVAALAAELDEAAARKPAQLHTDSCQLKE